MSRLVFDAADDRQLFESPSTPECRQSPRSMPIIRPAKLIVDKRETLCVVLNISEGGVRIRLFHPLPTHSCLAIEFDNGERHALEFIWQRGEQIGCSFAAPADLAGLLTPNGGQRARLPRVLLELSGVLYSDGVKTQISLRDISQRGAAIDCPAWLMIDETVRIECPELPTIRAKVRWRRPPRYGLVLERIFSLADLAKVCSELVQPADLGRREG